MMREKLRVDSDNVGVSYKPKMINPNAITLIALIITIIILLILAGVTINLTLGENGIIKLANDAGKNWVDSENKELEGLDKLYSQMLIATGDDTKITVNVEELKEIIQKEVDKKLEVQLDEKVNAKVEEKLENYRLNNPYFIDTNNLISTIATSPSSGYSNANYSYTATQDCVIVGSLTGSENGHILIKINDISMGGYFTGNYGFIPISFYLRKGDTISFTTRGGKTIMDIRAYGLK